ncbi:MAG: hypothetical protein J6S14_15150 [Clostridia bacterium]|nr:hypothetical protein [Clostridia bacterium]
MSDHIPTDILLKELNSLSARLDTYMTDKKKNGITVYFTQRCMNHFMEKLIEFITDLAETYGD